MSIACYGMTFREAQSGWLHSNAPSGVPFEKANQRINSLGNENCGHYFRFNYFI